MGLTHEFGIMQINPTIDSKFNNYEPQKYNAISIHDDCILPLLDRLNSYKCYWHSLDREEFGIAYYGITLIPPTTAKEFLNIFEYEKSDTYNEIVLLFKTAILDDKYIIHFGI